MSTSTRIPNTTLTSPTHTPGQTPGGPHDDAPRPDRLSERELQVLRLVAEGWSNRVIAEFLAITERTVKNHLTNIMGKLHAHDRTHAVVTAVRLGWMEI